MHPDAELPATARAAIDIWLRHVDEHVPDLVEGLYVVGSLALGNWTTASDIDIVAVSSKPPTDSQVAALGAAHTASHDELSGQVVDGPFICWTDLEQPPRKMTVPWSLDGAFHYDEECFELNPVVWKMLASHAIAVRGPDRTSLSVHADTSLLRDFVASNTESYWRSIPEDIDAALADPLRREFSADLISWSVLEIARMYFTARTGEITSKKGAGEWLRAQAPEHGQLITLALTIRDELEAEKVDREIAADTAAYMNVIADLVASTTEQARRAAGKA